MVATRVFLWDVSYWLPKDTGSLIVRSTIHHQVLETSILPRRVQGGPIIQLSFKSSLKSVNAWVNALSSSILCWRRQSRITAMPNPFCCICIIFMYIYSVNKICLNQGQLMIVVAINDKQYRICITLKLTMLSLRDTFYHKFMMCKTSTPVQIPHLTT